MRFSFKYQFDDNNILKYKVGNTRVIKKFLWFPKLLDEELRWLEWANIKQTFSEIEIDNDLSLPYYERYDYVWTDVSWAD